MATAWRSASWFLPAGHLPAGLPLVVTEIGESFWHHGDHVIREHSGIIALEWVIEGQMELEIDGSAQFVGPGQGFLLRRGEQQRYACVGSRARKRYIGVAGTWAAALVDGLPVVLADPDVRSLQLAFARLRRLLLRGDPVAAHEASAIIYRRLIALRGGGETSAGKPAFEAALAILDRTTGSTVDVAAVARSVGLSRAQLHRLFRARLGTTPLRYWLALHMRRAAGLLIGSGLSARTIAARLGYREPLYFCAVFKRVLGESPSAFRVRHRQPALPDPPANP